MVSTELGGTVSTCVECNDIAVVEHVVQTAEVGHQGVLGSIGLDIAPLDGGTSLHVVVLEVVGLETC